MAIQFVTKVVDRTLEVKASGFDENVAEVQQYGLAVIELCRKSGVTHVLCDERELEYRLSTVETYEAAQFIAENAPRVARVAIVCHPQYAADAQFWETVAVTRGLTVRAFRSLEPATQWLNASGSSLVI